MNSGSGKFKNAVKSSHVDEELGAAGIGLPRVGHGQGPLHVAILGDELVLGETNSFQGPTDHYPKVDIPHQKGLMTHVKPRILGYVDLGYAGWPLE